MKMKVMLAGLLPGMLALAACSSSGLNPAADTNHDDEVSFTEFNRYMKETIFTEFDADRDGMVTMAEWRRLEPDAPASKFRKADRSGNGSVTRAEADAHLEREGSMKELFAKIDTDGNGSLSEAEIAAFQAKMKKQTGPTELAKLKQATE